MPDERLTSRGWAGIGLAGSVAMSVAAPGLVGESSSSWWYGGELGDRSSHVVFYAGMVVLCVAWLGVGRRLRRGPSLRPSALILIGALWCLPLVLGPPLFSHDMYSYMAQGEILHLGLNPYGHAPNVLAGLGHEHLLATVSPFWRGTTSPYGPLFLGLASVIMGVVGSTLILGVLLMRALELVGLALLAVFVPRLARALGADPLRAVWIAVISPLVLLELIAAGHNDALMIGLLVAGVTLAMERRPLAGITLCAIAASVKLPAAAGIVFIAVAWANAERARSGDARAVRALALSAATAVVVLAAVSAGTGLGLSWISSGVLSTPGRVHLAITPVTATGWSIASLLHLLGVAAHAKAIESAIGVAAIALTGVLALALIYRARYENMVLLLGTLLLASVFAGPATWPWYLTWGLALIACCGLADRSRALPLALVLAVFVVKPDGILALSIHTAPFVLAAYVIAGGAAWHYGRRRGGDPAPWRVRGLARSEQPALTNS